MNNSPSLPPDDNQQLMHELKKILLNEDRRELKNLQDYVNDPEKMSSVISPVIQKHLDFLKENFSNEYQEIINQLIEEKLQQSQEDLLNILFPVLGKMVKKFVTYQFQLLKENADRQINEKLAFKGFFQKMKTKFSGKKNIRNEVLAKLDQLQIEEIYLIQKASGLLIGNVTLSETIDKDILAGMLTAIKSFSEDAFKREKEELEMIEYQNHKIFIQSYHSYYMAIAIAGSLSTREKMFLTSKMMNFAELELKRNIKVVNEEVIVQYSEKLSDYFSPTLDTNTIEATAL